MKNKREDYYEHCEIIKDVIICSHPSLPIIAYYLDNGNLAWETDVSELDKVIGYESFFISYGFKHNDYFIIPGVSYIPEKDEEVQTVYIFNSEGKLVNRIFVEDKFKEKLRGPTVEKNIECLSANDKYLGVGTYDGYFFLFTLKGELLSVWHTPSIKKEDLDKLTSLQNRCSLQGESSNGKIIQITENGTVHGNIYGEYYPINSLDLENNYVGISYNSEFVLLKITKI